MIDLTGVNLVALVKQAYALSQPRGLGRLAYEPDVLSDADAQALIDRSQSASIAVSLDYVKGRGVKLVVFRRDGRLEIQDAWYDHTTAQLTALLACVRPAAVTPEVGTAAHSLSCECSVCDRRRSIRADAQTTDLPAAGSSSTTGVN